MILTRTSEYALKILSYMATTEEDLFSAKLLYENLGIPKRYLGRLLTDLTKKGLISSTRGRNGGYIFSKKLEDIHLSDIIDAVEGFDSFDRCIVGKYQCELNNPCPMHAIWAESKEKILNTFKNTTLADLQKQASKTLA